MIRPALGLGLELYDGPRDPRAMGEAVLAFYDAVGAKPQRMTFRRPKARSVAFRRETFDACLDDLQVPSLTLWADGDDTPSVTFFLRFVPDPDVPLAAEFEYRHVGVAMPAPSGSPVPAPLLRLIRSTIDLAPVVQGAAGWFRDEHAAAAECWRGSVGDEDEATRERLHVDARSWSSKRRRLRRLYPVTVIGRDLWAQLPPMPQFEHPPRIEDLGDCKMITAWPTLCGPRDPEFLRDTRSLREWLWPYTIQNPADHVDNDPPLTDSPGSRSSP